MIKTLFFLFLSISSLFGIDGKSIYVQKCQNCHGENGTISALGRSDKLLGWSQANLLIALQGYKNGTRSSNGFGVLMKKEISPYNNDEIKALASYVAGFKK